MLTAIIIRLISEFATELSGLIDLYSTLQTNLKAYRINYWITGVLGSLEFCYGLCLWELLGHSIPKFLVVEICIVTLGMEFGAWLLRHKPQIKKFIKRKKISKSMKRKWKERKGGDDSEEKTEEDTKGIPRWINGGSFVRVSVLRALLR